MLYITLILFQYLLPSYLSASTILMMNIKSYLKDRTSIRKRLRFKIQIIINRYSHIFSKDIYMVNVYNSILTYKVRRIIKNNVIVS